MAKNLLDNLDYCIRKAIGVYCIPRYLQAIGESQRNLAHALGASESEVCKWKKISDMDEVGRRITTEMDSKSAPRLDHLLKASVFFGKPIYIMLQDILYEERKSRQLLNESQFEEIAQLAKRVGEERSPVLGIMRKGEDHFNIINKLQKSRYVGFFVSAEENRCVEHLIIDSAMATDSATVPAAMRIVGKAENAYECSIVSPPNQGHLYINVEQRSGKYDRGVIVFCVDDDMQGQFKCGSGYILSTDRKNGDNRIQWIIVLRIGAFNDALPTLGSGHLLGETHTFDQDEPYKNTEWLNKADFDFVGRDSVRQADSIVGPVLKEKMPCSDDCFLSFSCIKKRQKEFYENVYKKQLEDLGFIDDWNETHLFAMGASWD